MNDSKQTQLDKLMELKQLYESGILTKEEMEAEKAKILKTTTPKDKSPNNEIPPFEATGSSFASTSDGNIHSRNNKVILGIATVIVVAVVAVISLFLSKLTEPKEAVTDDIEVPQLKLEDPYIDCIKIKDLFEIIRKDDSSELRTFLTKNGFKAKGKDEEYSSAVWSKIYGSGTEADTVSILMDKITGLVYLDLSCTKDAIMNKWISEIKELGYTFEAPAVEGGDTILSFNKSDGTSGLIQYMSSPKKNRLNVITNFAFIIENDDNSDDVRVKDDDYLFTFVGKIEGSATQYPFKMAINVYGEGDVSGYYIVTNGGNERVSLKGTIENWTDKFEGAITFYEFDEAKDDYTGFYFQGDLTKEYNRSGSFTGYCIYGRYKNGSDISWPFTAVSR